LKGATSTPAGPVRDGGVMQAFLIALVLVGLLVTLGVVSRHHDRHAAYPHRDSSAS
jgi:hypothetical protein